MASGRLDIAVLFNAQPVTGLEIAPLASDALLLVRRAEEAGHAAADAEVTLREVARLPLVIPTRPNAIRMHIEAEMARAGCRPEVALEIDGVAAILDLVQDGAGCAILSRHALAGAAQAAAFQACPIVTATGARLRIPLYTAVSSLRPTTGTQQAVLALVRALAHERLDAPC